MFEKPEFRIDELKEFLVRARKQGYAGGAKTIENHTSPGFREFPLYVEGPFTYKDKYTRSLSSNPNPIKINLG